MNLLFLHSFNLERVQLLIKRLTQILQSRFQQRHIQSTTIAYHDKRFVDLLPQMRSKNLNQRNFERRNFAVHENAGQIKLHLKADINI